MLLHRANGDPELAGDVPLGQSAGSPQERHISGLRLAGIEKIISGEPSAGQFGP